MTPCLYCRTPCTGDFCEACRRYDREGLAEQEADQRQCEREEFRLRNAETIEIWRRY